MKILNGGLAPSLIRAFCMGFSSGLPLMVIYTLFQAYLKEAGVNLTSIGFMAFIGIPYSLKFFWSPWLDYYKPPLGRRKGWLIISQSFIILSLLILSWINPLDIILFGTIGFALAFFSATQDIVVDAYRREDLEDEDLSKGTAFYQWGYRLGMLLVSGGGLIIADNIGWPNLFRLIAFIQLIGPIIVFYSPEPKSPETSMKTLTDSIVKPLKEFFSRPTPYYILAFVFFYKFGDQLAISLNTAFFMEKGYSKKDIGLVVKIFGTSAIFLGIFLGNLSIQKYGLRYSLWLFGFLQIVTSLGFALFSILEPNIYYLATFITIEHAVGAAGTNTFVVFMLGLTNKEFTATQYALLSSLMSLPRTILSSPSGWLVTQMGWPLFYCLAAFFGLPGIVLLYILDKKKLFKKH